MIIPYYQYNRMDPAMEHFIRRMNEIRYRNYAGELLASLMQSPGFNMEELVKKTVAILRLTGTPVQEHITCVYRSDLNGIRKDWKLSGLACSIIILAADSSADKVREIQDELIHFAEL